MLGGELHHLVRVLLLHIVDGPEQIVEAGCRRHPKQRFRVLLRLVEDAVWLSHRQPHRIASGCELVSAIKHEVEPTLEDVKVLVLVGMDMRWNEGAGWKRRVPRK